MAYDKWKLNPKLAPTVRSNHHQAKDIHFVSDSAKSTSTPSKSTKSTSQRTKTTVTQQELFPKICQTSISSAVASLVRLFLSLEKEADLKIHEALFSLKSQGFYPLKDLNYSFLKMSDCYYHTIKGEPLEPSLQPFLDWGIGGSTRYLTARISESPKTGNGCSLSDILEKEVHKRYFLSPKAVERIMRNGHEPERERVIAPAILARDYKGVGLQKMALVNQ